MKSSRDSVLRETVLAYMRDSPEVVFSDATIAEEIREERDEVVEVLFEMEETGDVILAHDTGIAGRWVLPKYCYEPRGEISVIDQHCAICSNEMGPYEPRYPNRVCESCAIRAVSEPGVSATTDDSLVYIDGIRCWQTKFGFDTIVMREAIDSADYTDFWRRHRDQYGPIHSFSGPEDNGRTRSDDMNFSQTNSTPLGISLIRGNIEEQQTEALLVGVTDNPSLSGGAAGAINDAAAVPLEKVVVPRSIHKFDNATVVETEGFDELGDVVATGNYGLSSEFLLFACSTPAGRKSSPAYVQRSIQEALKLIEDLRINSVSISLLGTGAGALDVPTATEAICSTLLTSRPDCLERVQLVAHSESDYREAEPLVAEANSIWEEPPMDALRSKASLRVQTVTSKLGGEVTDWIDVDPYQGEVTSVLNESATPENLSPEEFVEQIDVLLELEELVPEGWLSYYGKFNSQLDGRRTQLIHPALDRGLFGVERALIGALRGLEYPISEYADIIALDLLRSDVREENQTNRRTAEIRYQIPSQSDVNVDYIEAQCNTTAINILHGIFETMSELDFDHPMSSTLGVHPIGTVVIGGYLDSILAYELTIPYADIEEVVKDFPDTELVNEHVGKLYIRSKSIPATDTDDLRDDRR